MKILITGAGGFVGSHLADRLVERGCEVRAFVHYNSRNHWGWLESSPYNKEFEIVSGDIRDEDMVRAAVKGVDKVLHLAALIGIPYSYYSPDAYCQTNTKGTLNILQACRDFNINKLVVTSTSEVYGTAQFIPITEEHPLNPQSPYAASKAAADFMTLSFYRSFSLPVAVIRPFNTYGPRQSARAVIPTIITQVLNGQKKIKLGALHPTRDLTFVKDIVDAFIKVGDSQKSVGQVINIGNNSEISVKDLAELIGRIMGVKIKIECQHQRLRPKESEVERLCADNNRAKRLLGWFPRYTLEEGLKETIKWFRRNKGIYKPGIYNI